MELEKKIPGPEQWYSVLNRALALHGTYVGLAPGIPYNLQSTTVRDCSVLRQKYNLNITPVPPKSKTNKNGEVLTGTELLFQEKAKEMKENSQGRIIENPGKNSTFYIL